MPHVTEEMDFSFISNDFCAEVFQHFLLSPLCPEQGKGQAWGPPLLLCPFLCVSSWPPCVPVQQVDTIWFLMFAKIYKS